MNEKLISIVIYGCIFILVTRILYYEYKDSYCPAHKTCDPKGAGAFAYTEPNDNDTCINLLKKIEIASKTEQSSIKWRKSLVLSIIISAFLSVIIFDPWNIPSFKKFIPSVLVCFLIIYFYFDYYSYHVYGIAERNIKESLEILNEKCIKN